MKRSIFFAAPLVFACGISNVLAKPIFTDWVHTEDGIWYRDYIDDAFKIHATVSRVNQEIEYTVETTCWDDDGKGGIKILSMSRVQVWLLGESKGSTLGCDGYWYTEEEEQIRIMEETYSLPQELKKQ